MQAMRSLLRTTGQASRVSGKESHGVRKVGTFTWQGRGDGGHSPLPDGTCKDLMDSGTARGVQTAVVWTTANGSMPTRSTQEKACTGENPTGDGGKGAPACVCGDASPLP